ncbi:MAG: AEC family transporter [Alphaproteobacteria bacterium]|jgi:predicted permease|nr:AEC family transporter [Alphaproteobacteria bacterium]
MLAVFFALVPTFLLIAAGYGLRRIRVFDGPFWIGVDRLFYFVLFPVLLARTCANARLGGLELGPLAGALLVGAGVVAASLVAGRRLVAADGPGFTSVFQGVTRFNSVVGVGIAQALYGAQGLAVFGLCMAVMIPVLNVWCVAVLARYAAPGRVPTAWQQARAIARNPLILGCLAGFALNVTGIGLPGPLDPAAKTMADAAVALGLLAAGAGLDLRAIGGGGRAVAIALAGRLLVMPVAVWLMCRLFGVDGLTREIAVLWAAMPTAPASYTLARQMGGDARLMATIITLMTLAAALTMPLMLALLA